MQEKIKAVLDELSKTRGVLSATVIGSHLFQLTNEKSDIDLLAVYLPSRYEMLMGFPQYEGSHAVDNLVKTAGGVELMLVPLHSFLRKLANGHMQYVEALFAEPIWTSDCWNDVLQLKDRVVTKALINAIIGYCRNTIKYFVNSQGYLDEHCEKTIRDIKEGKCKRHIDVIQCHRMCHELYRLMSIGDMKFGEKFYNPRLYMKIKSKDFTLDDLHLIMDELTKITLMTFEKSKAYNFDNAITEQSFAPVISKAYQIQC